MLREKSAFERQQDAMNELAHLMEDCDNGLMLKTLDIAKGYVEGRMLHRADEWVVFSQFRSADILRFLMLSLWACGQRACVVHHVHGDAALGRCRVFWNVFLISFGQGNKGAVGLGRLNCL
jgi:hypothetical protein